MGDIYERGKKMYDLNCKNHKTKYITAHLFVKERTEEKCIEFLRQVKNTCYGQIIERYLNEKHKPEKKRKFITFVSNGLENYKNALNKLFFHVEKL